MTWQYTPFILPLLLTGMVSSWLGLLAWQRRPARGAAAFAWLMAALTACCVAIALEQSRADLGGKQFFMGLVNLAIMVFPVALLVFALDYAGHDRWITRRSVALWLVVPAINQVLVWTNDWHHLVFKAARLDTSREWHAIQFTRGPWLSVANTYAYALVLAALIVLVRLLVRSSRLHRVQVALILIGLLPGVVISVLQVTVWGLKPGVMLMPFAFAAFGPAAIWSMTRHRLLDIAPIARDAVIESMIDPVIALDDRGRVADLNAAAARIIGRPANTIIGLPIAEALSGQRDLIERVCETNEAQVEIALGEGSSRRIYDLRVSPLRHRGGKAIGRLVVLRDITSRKQAELALSENEERMRQITGAIREVFWLRDVKTLELLYVNPAYETLWGRSCQSLYDNPISFLDAVHPDDKERVLIAIKQQYSGEFFNQEYRIIRPDGSIRWVWGRTFPIYDEAGELSRVVALAEDITDRKQTDENRERLIDELDAFDRMVAHDLTNPLAIILGYSTLLAEEMDDMPPDQVRECLRTVATTTDNTIRLVEELLLFAAVRKRDEVELGPLDMETITHEACERLSRQLADSETDLVMPESWPVAVGYGPWITEVWTNYISNAIKYGGAPPRVELGATVEDGGVRFWVRDNGPGLTEKEQAQLFQEFTRLHTHRGKGYGLGLSIARRIVERLGGEVAIDSAPGQGSTFSFRLPLHHQN
ncbi:MAG: PAS domain S-box protein [Anaerolineae bacterium]|nr:PAS domain S-box protein [Anaerolineae bacterium]